MTKIIACIDGSIYSHSVSDHAAWAATRLSASVDLLHVLGRRDLATAPVDLSGSIAVDAQQHLLEELANLDTERAKLMQKRGRLLLDEARTRLAVAGVIEVATFLRHGDLVETLAEREASADLIVIGKRGEAADFAKLHLGSNLERVVRASRRPVLVSSRAFRPINRLLIAFDGGESAVKGVDHVASSSLFNGLACHLVMVGADTAETRRKVEAAELRLRASGMVVNASLEAGAPDAVIAAKVERDAIDLLVMGAYGHSRIRNLVIGSTTTEMLRSCKIPVILFR
jgi:nucleotide-binding universal stress UspA family protein